MPPIKDDIPFLELKQYQDGQKIGAKIRNLKPMSVNDAWKGQRYKSKVYERYAFAVAYLLPTFPKLPPPPYCITFHFGFSNKAADWDNPVKPLQDILQEKYKFNDKEIIEAHVYKHIVKKGKEYFHVTIETITPERDEKPQNNQ